MQCSGKPDPTIAPEINTYINLWKEDTEKSGITVVLDESKQTLEVSKSSHNAFLQFYCSKAVCWGFLVQQVFSEDYYTS